ncbi:MAG: carbamoyltransferase HypF [Thermosphaera sp.]
MIATRLLVVGVVQGVGFRPFVDRVVRGLGLNGYVKNIGGSEVEIFLEGDELLIYEFIAALINERPPPAEIEELFIEFTEPLGFTGFRIEKSGSDKALGSMIPPDFAMCQDCLAEILDPSNPRYMYPFNSCAWCGPRFSMMYKVPYDRENTSMSKFPLCDRCLKEYRDPENVRRYHAQGISCPVDGPKVFLMDRDFRTIETKDPISEAAKLIDEGWIVAIKGIGGYHIAASASNDDVVLKLRKRKNRPYKPFAIMGLDTSVLKLLVKITKEDESLLNSPQAPILILPKKDETPVSRYVSPGLSHEGVFRAYTPLHYLLLMNTKDKFAIMTSGNSSGSPMCISDECAKNKLKPIVDFYLVHNREIVNRVDDSVLRKTGEHYLFLRRSRGYAPKWIRIGRSFESKILAFGGDLSNTFAIGFDDKVVISQYIGDLDSPDNLAELSEYIGFFLDAYGLGDRNLRVVVDKHKGYFSRRIGVEFAQRHGCEWVEVQHHYAHLLGAAFDNGLEGRIAGVALDGLGWGDDESIWGGEVIVFDTFKGGYERVGTINWVPITSDVDARKTRRLITLYFTRRGWSFEEILRLLNLKSREELIEHRMIHESVTKGKFVKATSTGRILDLVSNILGIAEERTYDGEPAIKLESVAHLSREPPILLEPGRITQTSELYVFDYDNLVDTIIEAKDSLNKSILAKSFLYSYGYYVGELVLMSAVKRGVDVIVASGGAIVNDYIYQGLKDRLALEGLTVHIPRRIPPGDGGLSFGQVIAAMLSQQY